MMIFRKLSFKTKLMTLFLAMSSITIIVSAISYVSTNRIEDLTAEITSKKMPKEKLAREMYSEYLKVRIHLRTLGLPEISKAHEEEAIAQSLGAIKNMTNWRLDMLTFPPLNNKASFMTTSNPLGRISNK